MVHKNAAYKKKVLGFVVVFYFLKFINNKKMAEA